ncbi:hypothetical protein [Gracilinema caldarium]|uniref:hypothetical protein n=1 Tax=Gracilinema caldarium TaxID=215591 RepID=UPI0026EBA0CE|nr:hypothetical protein [Gracilinema caldarium]
MKTEKTTEIDSLLDDSFEPSLPDIEDLPDLEMDTFSDLDLPEAKDTEKVSESTEAKAETLPDFGDLSEPEDFSVEELPKASESNSQFEELSSFEDLDFASFEEGSSKAEEKQESSKNIEYKKEEKKSSSSDEFTELSMDDFLDSESFETETVSEQNESEEEPLDIDLEFNESVDLNMMSAEHATDIGTVSEAKDTDLNLETVSDFDDFLSDLGEESEESEKSQEVQSQEVLSESEQEEKPSDFNDIEAVHKELEETAASIAERPQHERIVAAEPKQGTTVDLSTQLLMKIADELSSIKKELFTLKEELAVYKGNVPQAAPAEAEQEEKSSGFFDDEEDEKIALTGDELDNILNTAEFTEEAGAVITDVEDTDLIDSSEIEPKVEAETVESLELPKTPETVNETLSESFQLDDSAFLSDKEDLISEDLSDISASISESAPVSEVEKTEQIEEEIVELPMDENLATLQEEGVRPITEAPEDISYLEEELESTSFEDSSQLDLSEAVIEEPDLSGIVLEEHPLEEPSIEDIHIDLDTEEVLHVEDQGSDLTEIEVPEEDNIELLDLETPSIEEEPLPAEPTIEETLPRFEDLEEISTPVQEESFEEVIPEGFVVESEEAEPIELSQAPAEEEVLEEIEEVAPAVQQDSAPTSTAKPAVSPDLTQEIRAVLSYMDQLLESLPEEKIEEFAKSEYFETYKKLFEELGLA